VGVKIAAPGHNFLADGGNAVDDWHAFSLLSRREGEAAGDTLAGRTKNGSGCRAIGAGDGARAVLMARAF
jgi:hypothetical protein